jgi:hypothetical protein
VSLKNPDHKVSAVETLLVDEDNNLTCTGCTPDPVRAPSFMCFAHEQGEGGCKVVMVDVDASELIEIGNGTVFTVDYVVSRSRPSDQCISIAPIDSIIADDLQKSLSVCEKSGEICFMICGDLYPQDCYECESCGDGIVDIFDELEAMDIVLGLQTATECQMLHGDVPLGVPPYCGNPAGVNPPNCETDGVIDVFDVLVIIDKSLSKMNCCDYCMYGEIY